LQGRGIQDDVNCYASGGEGKGKEIMKMLATPATMIGRADGTQVERHKSRPKKGETDTDKTNLRIRYRIA